jgi:hypothetical protein
MEPLELTISQKFELERSMRAIDSCNNLDELRKVAKSLAESWMIQKAATNWIMKQNLGL